MHGLHGPANVPGPLAMDLLQFPASRKSGSVGSQLKSKPLSERMA